MPGATAAGPQAQGPARIVGRVDGDISLDMETRSLRGVQVFIVAGLVALALGAVIVSGAVLSNLPGLLMTLLPAVLVLGFLVVICGMAFGASPGKILSGAGRATRGAAARGAGAAARGVAGGVRSGARAGMRAGASSSGLSTSITVRRFRVKAMTGEVVPCVQQGDLIGDEVRHGDYVLLEGRRTRDGHMLLSRVDVLQTPSGPVLSVIRTRSGFGHNAALVADRVCLVLGLALAVAVVVMAVRLVW